ncbi:protein ARK2N isoform X3 [Brachyistius frenatus]|uniref:protein ARK2N isoform X3 n=1 Tax=Brachyistius frenatus TaxID=100188 RepID=UPI0037E7B405
MKMADSEKAEEFVDAECPPECLDETQSATASVQGDQDEHLKTETTTTTSTSSPTREKELDSPLQTEGEQSLLSMPCLMKELRRDSPESQNASTGSDKPASHHIYESDSSNPCMLSPSSSGHLADSDTLSSGEERAAPPVGDEEEGGMEAANDPGQAAGKQTSATASGGRKSRRSRSESEMPPNAMAAKKNRCQPTMVAAGGQEKQTNGKLAKVKGHRSQKHKERMRLLRQKREAAARKKYNLLQDSSTSDSELTCDSSTSSSDDEDDDTSGGSKTIKTDIPDGPPVVGHYDISDTDSYQESMSVETVRPTVIKHELKTHRGQDMASHSGCIRALSSIAGHVEAELSHKEGSQHKGQINIASSDSEVEIVGVQEKARCSHPCGGVIKSLSSWKENSVEQLNSTNQSQLWTTVSPQPNWVSPPEVVDLTLDEDAGHKYLL